MKSPFQREIPVFVAGAMGLVLVVMGPLAENTNRAEETEKGHTVKQEFFGKTPDGIETNLFVISNANGLTMKVTDYGARLVALEAPDRKGKLADVTLGFDSVDKYVAHTSYFGCTTGRYANRIANGKFTLAGKEYKLATNNGSSHLHGGTKGFDRQVWRSAISQTKGAAGVMFLLQSPDGDEGYPGTLDVTVTYSLTDENELEIKYSAVTDNPTVLNLTNHAYWNLAGAESGDVLGQKMFIAADNYLPVDANLIPTGKLAPVKGTAMDFTEPQTIGSRIAETKKGVPPPGGYDHCYVLRGKKGELALAARAEDPPTGRVMEVYTTEPAIQFYTGNFLDGGSVNGRHRQHGAFCLETQHYPNSPNQPEFPTTELKRGQTYTQTTVYRFLTKP
jgi:aldose 1-epimerase